MSFKSYLYSVFFLTAFSATAQINFSWFPVQPSVNHNFTTDTSNTISNVIKIDSSILNSSFYLNRIVRFCDTCKNNHLLNDPSDSTYFLYSQPQFLKSNFVFLPPSTFYFPGKNSFVLKRNVPIGNTWLYDSLNNIHATLITRTTQNVSGFTDSVEVIKLTTNDTIIISKQMGIIQFPFTTISKHHYFLVGTENGINAGTRLKTFHDFFNFNAGDILQYEFSDFDFNFNPPQFTYGAEKWQILSVNNFMDSVVCQVKIIHLDSSKFGAGPVTINSYTQTLNKTFADSSQHLSNLYPQQEINASPYAIYINGLKYIHKVDVLKDPNNRMVKQFGETCPSTIITTGNFAVGEVAPLTDLAIIRNSKKIIGRRVTEGLGFTSEVYNDYDRVYKNCLIGYIKGSDTSGVIYWPNSINGIQELYSESFITVCPNPANEFISIKSSFYPVHITLTDLLGKEIFTKIINNNSETLSVKNLTEGVYFMISSGLRFTNRTKILIQH